MAQRDTAFEAMLHCRLSLRESNATFAERKATINCSDRTYSPASLDLTKNPATYTISSLISATLDGSTEAENQLAQFFLSKAVVATKRKLAGKLPTEDQEDVALSAVKSFCLGIRDGGIEYQGDKQLFALLHSIVDRKIRKLWQYHLAQKRDIRQVNSMETASDGYPIQSPASNGISLESIHVTPEEQPAVDRVLADLQTELRGLFSNLLSDLDEHPRKLLLAMLETDANNEALARKIGRSVASVERYRQLIRHKLEK